MKKKEKRKGQNIPYNSFINHGYWISSDQSGMENEPKIFGMFFHSGFAGIQRKLILQRNVTAAAAARRGGMS